MPKQMYWRSIPRSSNYGRPKQGINVAAHLLPAEHIIQHALPQRAFPEVQDGRETDDHPAAQAVSEAPARVSAELLGDDEFVEVVELRDVMGTSGFRSRPSLRRNEVEE